MKVMGVEKKCSISKFGEGKMEEETTEKVLLPETQVEMR